MNGEPPMEAQALSTDSVVNRQGDDAERMTVEVGAMCLTAKTDLSVRVQWNPSDPGMVVVSRIKSSASPSGINTVQNSDSSVNEDYQEGNPKRARLCSNDEDTSSSEMLPEGDDTRLLAGTVAPVKNPGQARNGGTDASPMEVEADKINEDSSSDANAKRDSDTESGSYELAPPKRVNTAYVPEEIPLSLEEQVFKNHLVTKAVFKSLDTKTLKNLRVVSKNFNNFATEILLHKQSLKFCICEGRVRLRTGRYNLIKKLIHLDLNQALEFMTNSVKLFHRLPTDYLELIETNLEAPALQNFLSEYGYVVKTLKLDIDPENATAFQHLLLHQVVNLETLFLNYVPPFWDKVCEGLKLFRDNTGWIKINNLKKIIFGKDCGRYGNTSNLLQNLVCASPNLQQVKGCRGMNFMAFLPNGDTKAIASTSSTSPSKAHLMKTLTFDPRAETLTLYSQFLDDQGELLTCLRIRKLKIEMDELERRPETWPQAAAILTQFLKMISPTLEKLVINGLIGFLEENNLQLPQFKMVSKVHFIITHRYNLSDFEKNILPSNCQIVHAFPNVQHLKITMYTNVKIYEEEFFNYFGKPSPILSLKTLEFIGSSHTLLPVCWLEQFSARAPNVTVANIGVLDISDFLEACKIVWTQLLNLQELKFTLDLTEDDEDVFVDGFMDVAFTGFSEETCKRLMEEEFDRIRSQSQNPELENVETVIRAEDWKDERKNASILDLKSLKSLRLDFDLESERDSYPVFLSCVAGLYAFKMCDKLKVSVGVDPTCEKYATELDKEFFGERTITRMTGTLETSIKKLARSLDSVCPYVTMDSSLN